MKRVKTIQELRRDFSKVKSCASDTDWFIAEALLFLIENSKELKIKRKATEWSLFAGEYMREGKSIKEAAKDWKKKNS